MKKGSAAGGATRRSTEARGAGLSAVLKGSAAEGATKNSTKAKMAPHVTRWERTTVEKYQAKKAPPDTRLEPKRVKKSTAGSLATLVLQEQQDILKEQEEVQGEEDQPVIFQRVPQLPYTETCDRLQDGSTDASPATLVQQERQDILEGYFR